MTCLYDCGRDWTKERQCDSSVGVHLISKHFGRYSECDFALNLTIDESGTQNLELQ